MNKKWHRWEKTEKGIRWVVYAYLAVCLLGLLAYAGGVAAADDGWVEECQPSTDNCETTTTEVTTSTTEAPTTTTSSTTTTTTVAPTTTVETTTTAPPASTSTTVAPSTTITSTTAAPTTTEPPPAITELPRTGPGEVLAVLAVVGIALLILGVLFVQAERRLDDYVPRVVVDWQDEHFEDEIQ